MAAKFDGPEQLIMLRHALDEAWASAPPADGQVRHPKAFLQLLFLKTSILLLLLHSLPVSRPRTEPPSVTPPVWPDTSELVKGMSGESGRGEALCESGLRLDGLHSFDFQFFWCFEGSGSPE